MKYLIWLSFSIIISVCHAQNEWKEAEQIPNKYRIDGSLSVREITDTTQMKNVVAHQHFIVKKSSVFTYVAIRSNTSSILNVYLISDKRLSVLHASAALGQIDMYYDGDSYIPESEEFDWIYRDPETWDEKHPEGVDTIIDFYARYGWMANAWNDGSYREVEMIIDNNLIDPLTRLVISYASMEEGQYGIRFKEGNETISLSGNADIDNQLHNGYIPKELTLFEKKIDQEVLVDIDGNQYETAKYGETIWMQESLRVTSDRDGNEIRHFYPNGDSTNIKRFGLLYDFETACKVCPKGWTLPSNEDWENLFEFEKQKDAGLFKDTQYWSGEKNSNASGLAIRPAGYGNSGEHPNKFSSSAIFWSASKEDDHFIWTYILDQGKDTIRKASQHPEYGFSIRCIKKEK